VPAPSFCYLRNRVLSDIAKYKGFAGKRWKFKAVGLEGEFLIKEISETDFNTFFH